MWYFQALKIKLLASFRNEFCFSSQMHSPSQFNSKNTLDSWPIVWGWWRKWDLKKSQNFAHRPPSQHLSLRLVPIQVIKFPEKCSELLTKNKTRRMQNSSSQQISLVGELFGVLHCIASTVLLCLVHSYAS